MAKSKTMKYGVVFIKFEVLAENYYDDVQTVYGDGDHGDFVHFALNN